MPTRTVYVKDTSLWDRARELTGKGGLSQAIEGFLLDLVKKSVDDAAGLKRHRIEVVAGDPEDPEARTEHIGFDGRLVVDWLFDVEGLPAVEAAVYQTRAQKLVLALREATGGDETVYHWAVYESLKDLSDDDQLRQAPKQQRADFLDALADKLGEQWTRWID